MQDTPIWKPILIVTVLALCGLCIYPPGQKLKPGLDLAGGTTLVYQVNVPSDQEAKTVIDQVIETLKKRVDPNGVRNLVWRRQAGNRIEIQMPLPPTETTQRRDRYLKLREGLFAGNIKKRELDSALRLPADTRADALKRLAGDHPTRQGLLEAMAGAYDRLTAARGPYEEAQERIDAMEGSAADDARDRLQTDLLAKTRVYLDAQKAFEAAQGGVLATNVDPNELELILSLPAEVVKKSKPKDGQDMSSLTRGEAVDRLIASHPDRAEQVRELAQAKALYDEVRGPLDDPNDLIALLRGSGVLEFRIAAPANFGEGDQYRQRLRERGPRAGMDKSYRWFLVDDVESFADNAQQRRALEENPVEYFAGRGLIGQAHGDGYYVLLSNTPDMGLTRSHADWKLTRAHHQVDENGFLAVGFELNRVGGQLMANLTGNNRGRPMAIVLDGRVISTPSINDKIHDQGIITGGRGGFSQNEQGYLLRTLNAGSLEGQLSEDPIYIRKFGPQLGQDNLQHGLEAAVWALVAVAAFMMVYYLFMGLVADMALAMNMVVILGAMAMLDATFTLPGIAGIVLTIGMAVDANVLIYERIREELERNADVRTAVRLGYEKALSTIIDANLTTLITCVILNYTATAEIKGFAITLMIGILATMFTVLFCTRVVVDVYLNVAKPKTISMLPTLVEPVRRLLSPNVDWIGKRYLLFTISAVLIVLGLIAIPERGKDLLDIEFRSGTQVGFDLAEGKSLSIGEARQRLTQASEKHGLPDLAGNRATVVTVDQVEGKLAAGFNIATLEQDATAVSNAIKDAFADVLDVQRSVTFNGMGPGHDAPPVRQAPVYAVRQTNLGDNINRPEVHTEVSDYLGGVAVVLEQLTPPQTVEQLTQRVQNTRLRPRPGGAHAGYRPFTVIGLDLAPAGPGTQAAQYRSAVVLVSEAGTNYIDSPEAFYDDAGLAATEWSLVHDALRRDASLGSVSNFSSQISRTMQQQAIVAMTLSILAVVVYIWVRFGSLRYGLAAIAALAHDVVIMLGLVAAAGWVYDTSFGQALMLSDFKINQAMVAAVLTLVGYSLNDTIVVFDRIRENRGRLAVASTGMINDAINQTISRTVITSGTTLLALGTLYIFGGDGVHGFAFAMLVGVLVGTYSSVAISAPLLLIGAAAGATDSKTPATQAGHTAA